MTFKCVEALCRFAFVRKISNLTHPFSDEFLGHYESIPRLLYRLSVIECYSKQQFEIGDVMFSP